MKESAVIMNLWPSNPPHSNGLTGPEVHIDGKIGHISQAQLWLYQPAPENNLHSAILIFPGGGYFNVNMESMGIAFAKWLASRGFTAVVAKYRSPNGIPEIVGEDALQAMLVMQQKATEWDIDPKKIGVCGYSSGGNTASWLCNTAPDNLRPNFQILFYPVISFKDDFTHVPTRENFLGKDASPELIAEHSNELHVNAKTPVTFIALSNNDQIVPPVATTKYYTALHKCNVPACMYIFPTGGHGWTFDSDFEYLEVCKELLYKWLKPIVEL